MASGYSLLGAVLGNAASGGAPAAQRGELDAARAGTLMLKARQAREAAISRGRYRDEMVAAGVAPQKADLLSAMMIGGNGGSISGLNSFLTGEQMRGVRGDALDAANGHDLNHENALLGVLSGRPMTLTRAQDNVVLNPSMTPDSQTIEPTSIGQAIIGKYGRPDSGGKFNITAPSSAEALAVLGGRPSASPFLPPEIDPDKMKAFLIWQGQMAQRDPRYADGDFAIGQYAGVLKDDAARQARDQSAYAASLQEDATPPQPEPGLLDTILGAVGLGGSPAEQAGAAKADQFEVGKTYVDARGTKARYLGNGHWQITVNGG